MGRNVTVKLPKGLESGKTLRLRGQGGNGNDLLLEIELASDSRFQVDGRDIQSTLDIWPWQAALGGSVDVPTLGGTVQLTLKANSKGGQKVRLRGRGLPGRTTDDTAGDQFVTLNVVVPVTDSDDDKAFFESMKERFGGRG